MEHLPDPRQRSALLDALSHVIERSGFETFVRAPILEPSSTFFPDTWEPSARGVRTLSLRLLTYAGLDDLDATVELDGPEREDATGSHQGAAAWFAGIDEDGTCIFGAHTRQLAVADAIVGTMCHEVAHAFREHHGLAGEHRETEEEMTDITTVYLGFGVLTTNNAYRFRKSGGLQGTMAVTKWSTQEIGYLSPQAMSFLLAAQVVARGTEPREVKRIASLLETNQAAFFKAAHRELARDVDALRLALGIPPVETWPSERDLAVPSLRGDAKFTPVEADGAPAKKAGWNAGSTVFRVRSARSIRFGVAGAIVAIAPAVFLADHALGNAAFAAVVAGAVLGVAIGTRFFVDECSDGRCEARADRHATTCPKCGGTFRGVIYDAADRLVVEEALTSGAKIESVVAELAAERRKRFAKRAMIFAGVALAIAIVAALGR